MSSRSQTHSTSHFLVHELATLSRLLADPHTYPAVLATLVSVAGSSYRRAGARMLVDTRGHKSGSISGGCLEEDVRTRATFVAETGRADLIVYDTTTENDLVWGVGLGCHGVVGVLLEKLSTQPSWAAALADNFDQRRTTALAVVWQGAEPALLGTYLARDVPVGATTAAVFRQSVSPPLGLVVFGAGDDAQPLVRFAKELGWHVTVADPRPGFATAERFPLADVIEVAPASMLVPRSGINADMTAVVMTHHYVHDVPILRDLFARQPAYIGLLGPKKRAGRILADLSRDGNGPSPEMLSRFHAPVGLDVGAETPQEVALSVVAEIQASLAGRNARPLREREQPIHG